MRHLCLLLLCCMPLLPRAQNVLSRGELGANIGAMHYIGDLTNQKMVSQPHLGYGGMFRYNISNRWAVAAGGTYGRVESNDYLELRNLSFRSPIVEGWARAEFNFIPFSTSYKIFRWTPYLFGGVGICLFNPQATYTDPETGHTQWVALQPLGTEGQQSTAYPNRLPYRLSTITIPFGIGGKFRPWDPVIVAVEYGYRKTFTDYLDDVSTTYADPETLSGSVAQTLADRSHEVMSGYANTAGTQRGDDSLKDWYGYLNVSVTVSMELLFGWLRTKNCDPNKQ